MTRGSRDRGATILESETFDLIDPGVALFAPSVVCDAGEVSQLVQMPSYEAGEPLVAEVTYRAQGLFGLSVGFTRAWTQLGATSNDEWRTERVCLGAAAYGGPVLVQLGAREQHPSCFDQDREGKIEVDRLDIVLADPDECPAPGEVPNGTADEGGGGWQFEEKGAAYANFAAGVGRGGSSGVRLAREDLDLAAAWLKLSVPSSDSIPSPALRFWWKGTSGRPFNLEIGRYEGVDQGTFPLDVVIGNNSDVNVIYCLPPWTHGNVVDLIFKSLADSPVASELIVDDVEIVSEARCGTSTDLLDPGFEAGTTRIMGVALFSLNQEITLRSDPELARTGEGVLEISYSNEDAVSQWETWVFVPPSNGNEGPAIVFWSNVPTFNEIPIRSVLGRAAVDPADLSVGGGWRRNERCLPPDWSGRWFRFEWRLGESPRPPPAPVSPPIRIYIDDLELMTSLRLSERVRFGTTLIGVSSTAVIGKRRGPSFFRL